MINASLPITRVFYFDFIFKNQIIYFFPNFLSFNKEKILFNCSIIQIRNFLSITFLFLTSNGLF